MPITCITVIQSGNAQCGLLWFQATSSYIS